MDPLEMGSGHFYSIKKLKDAETYIIWKFQIDIYLKSSGLFGLVQPCEEPTGKEAAGSSAKSAASIQQDAKFQRLIISTVDENVLVHIMTCNSGLEMYNKLKSIFEKDSDYQKVTLLSQLYNFSYETNKSVADNISKLQNIANRLTILGEQISDTMIIAKIISSLPEQFKHFSTAWESTPREERTLTNIIARLSSEESIRVTNSTSTASGAAFTVNSQKRKFKPKFCKHCKKKGHSMEECYHLKNKAKSQEKEKEVHCRYCKKPGHVIEDCFTLKNKEKKERNEVNHVTFLTNSSPSCTSSKGTEFVVDSGSSSHLVNSQQCLVNRSPDRTKFNVAKAGESIVSEMTGDVVGTKCTLKGVRYLPELRRNLLSVHSITQHDGIVTFTKDKVIITKGNKTVLEGKAENGLFTVSIDNADVDIAQTAQLAENAEVWHRKLGHLGKDSLKKLEKMCLGMNLKGKLLSCEICLQAKQQRKPFSSERQRADRPLALVHTDVSGPVHPETHDGKRYVLSFIDDYTHFAKVYLLRSKSEVESCFKNYVNESERFFDKKVHTIRLDNGSEYCTNSLIGWCRDRGLVLDFTTVNSPSLNGTAERYFRSLFEKARALIFDSGLEKEMWGEAILVSTYLLNRSPTTALENCTPFEKWYGKPPNLKYLQVFGSIVSAKETGYVKKLDPRAKTYIFIGYGSNCYRLWDKNSRKIIRSRDVELIKIPEHNQSHSSKTVSPGSSTYVKFPKETDPDQAESANHDLSDIPDATLTQPNVQINDEIDQSDEEQLSETETRYPMRDRRKPDRYNRESEIYSDFSSFSESDNLLNSTRFQNLELDSSFLTYEEAISGTEKHKWLEAINKEKESIIKTNTWEYVDAKKAKGKKILTSKWVLKIKENGVYKARLVARGFNQSEDTYSEIFSPVVNNTSLRTLIAIAAQTNKIIKTFDIQTAFLNGVLEEEIYMKVPEGFEQANSNKVCLLKKSLYGLKQSPSCWNKAFKASLEKKGLLPLKTDQCIFKNKLGTLFLAIYVDDGILFGNNVKEMNEFLLALRADFDITIDHAPKSYVGLEISNRKDEICISQKSYVAQVLQKFNMHESNGVDSPLIVDRTEREQEDHPSPINFPYREAVGSLLYLSTKTRPDISFAVNYESRRLQNPTDRDVNYVKRTMRYLRKHNDLAIHYSKTNSDEFVLTAYSDSDYAGDPDSCKSTSGYVICLNGGPVSWSSQAQRIVSCSSTESEYISAAQCCKEFIFLKYLIEELTGKTVTVNLFVDNKSTICLIKTDTFKHRTKHIQVRYHFIRQMYQERIFELFHIPSAENLADLLTKDLQRPKLVPLVEKLLVKLERGC